MDRWTRLPTRVRLTLAFALGTAVVIATFGVFVYASTGGDLLAAADAGLRSRAEVIAADVRANGPSVASVGAQLIEPDEAFAQVASSSGTIEQSSAIIKGTPLLPASTIRAVTHPTFFDRQIPGIDNTTRVIAVPVDAPDGREFVLVGSSLQDRKDELIQLAATLSIGGVVALLVLAMAGWLLAGALLRPVERMRSEAAVITSSDLGSRLSLPTAQDEITRLGTTLNAMLDRIQESFEHERRFVNNASHELRTPVAILKAELDLALTRARTPHELEAALRSASEETDHLARLAEDLLVLSRAHGGRLSIHRSEVLLPELLEEVARHFEPRAASAGVRIEVDAPPGSASLDPVRMRQALDDLLDNAVRHTPLGGTIRLCASQHDGVVLLRVEDSGRGFSAEFLPHAFEPFSRNAADKDGAGLGLAIVRAIAQAHGGTAEVANRAEGGGAVTIAIGENA
ncbi:MAG: ATP-binding protein [Actinomycetota bacterium]|nr:ATP-binding protein [Actinomycetota bacterium]